MSIMRTGRVGDIYCYIGHKDLAGRPSKICGEIVAIDYEKDHRVVQLRSLENGEDISVIENKDRSEMEHNELYPESYINPANWIPHRHFLAAQKVIEPVRANIPAPVRVLLSLLVYVLFYFVLVFVWVSTWAIAAKVWGFGIGVAFLLSLVPVTILMIVWGLLGDFAVTLRYIAEAISV